MKYIYPKLPSAYGTFSFFRLSGNGLANCLFIYARAITIAHKYNLSIITPTWFNLSIGPYLRNEIDKRHYINLFSPQGEITGLKKLVLLTFSRKIKVRKDFKISNSGVYVVEGLGNYFSDIINDHEIVLSYLYSQISPKILITINNFDFTNCIAVHIRLGDYSVSGRKTPMEWYIQKIRDIGANGEKRFLLFSDGKEPELRQVLEQSNVERVNFGSSIADIFAISRCSYLIASDSTFSAWGAYLGQVPCCFYKKHFGQVLQNEKDESIEFKE